MVDEGEAYAYSNLPVIVKSGAIAGISVYVLFGIIEKVQKWRRRRELNRHIAVARTKRDAQLKNAQLPEISKTCYRKLVEMSGIELAKEITSQRVSAIEAVNIAASISRKVAYATNAVTETCFEEAIEAAHSVDYGIKNNSAPLPLAGVPISVKDSVNMKGYLSTCGLAARALIRSEMDSILVTILKNAGAIPIVRSATPQALMLPETTSRLWGVCKNPWNLQRTPGGSSGGEAALLSARATWIGIGSDIGGSLRIPAHFCGIVAFKPTPQRLTRHGMTKTNRRSGGQEAIISVPGPMARSVDDCESVMKLWLDENSPVWSVDPYTAKVPWKSNLYHATNNSKIRVGYFDNDGWFNPAPACKRVVHEAVNILKDSGIECVPFTPRNVTQVAQCYYALLSADGNMRSFLDSCDGEDLHPVYRKLHRMSKIPAFVRPILSAFFGALGWNRLAALLQVTGRKFTHEYWRWVVERKRLQKLWLDAMKSEGLDAIVCPALALPALKHGASANLTPACSYTFLWNLLHWPAGVVPVGTVGKDEMNYVDDSVPNSEPWFRAASKSCLDSEGLPVSAQIVTLPFQDELCLRLMRVVEQSGVFNATPKLVMDLER